jgi:uncharacterized protein (DUF305 family)
MFPGSHNDPLHAGASGARVGVSGNAGVAEGDEVMRRCLSIIGAAALAVLVTMTGCSNSGNQPVASSTSAAGSSSTPAASAHNQADVTFAQSGIPHHEQAIPMSDTILGKQGIDPRVVQLATQFKADQGPELQQMHSWLSQWGQPPLTMSPGMEMPGMLPDQDISALQNAQGVDATKKFLTEMIECHEGTIAMAEDEIKDGQYPPAVALAHSISTREQQENTTMQGILDSL